MTAVRSDQSGSRKVDPVQLAQAREVGISGRSRQKSYDRKFNLSGIPS
jgi:hypothetical protein